MNKTRSYQNFFSNICYLRRVKGLTQKQMSSIIGISVNTLRRIESGTSYPRAHSEMLRRVCDHFDISADAMIKSNLDSENSVS